MTGLADVGKHATQTTNEKRGAGESKLPRTNATVDSNLSDNATGASGSGGDAFRQQPYNSGRAKQSTKNSKRQTSGSGQKAPKGATSKPPAVTICPIVCRRNPSQWPALTGCQEQIF